MKILE